MVTTPETKPEAILSTDVPTYTYRAWDDLSNLVEARFGLSWPSACGLLGNQAEGDDIECATVTRDSDEVDVLGYHKLGMD